MAIFTLFDHKNKKIKYRLILAGLFIVFASAINYETLSYPLQKLYLYGITYDVEKIELYANTLNTEEFLISIEEPEKLQLWIDTLQNSIPYSTWDNKIIPSDFNYSLKIHLSNSTYEVLITPYQLRDSNVYIGDRYIAYNNDKLLEMIETLYPQSPTLLTIQPADSTDTVTIKNSNVLDILWRNIMWQTRDFKYNIQSDLFALPAALTFENGLRYPLAFSSDLSYVSLQNKDVIRLSPYLKNTLSEQLILSRLSVVESLDTPEDIIHTTQKNQSYTYGIELDPNGFYGLYRTDHYTNEKILLHTVHSEDTRFYLLRSPYILILEEREENQYFLLLINQNIPEKHRYIEKNQFIDPYSIAIDPQNANFSYIMHHSENSTLHFSSSYYNSPKVIASGIIIDTMFLSSNYLVYTQQLETDTLLCVYNTAMDKHVKYTIIPGNIILLERSDESISFLVQSNEPDSLKQGKFTIDTSLSIQPATN